MIYALIHNTTRKLVMLPYVTHDDRLGKVEVLDFIPPQHESSSGRIRCRCEIDTSDAYESMFFPHVLDLKIVTLEEDVVTLDEIGDMHNESDDDGDALVIEIRTKDSERITSKDDAVLSPSDASRLLRRAKRASQSVSEHLMTTLLEALDTDLYERGSDNA